MKYRIVDLLQCSCGKSNFVVKNAATKRVPFVDSFSEVGCKTTCAFKGCSPASGGVKPSDCMECYSHEVMEGTVRCACGREWQIVAGIPRLLPDALSRELKKTQETFSSEWKMFRFGECNWGQDIDYRKTLFLDAMGAECKIKYLDPRNEVKVAFSDHSKAERVFGEQRKTSLEDGIQAMAEWVKEHGIRESNISRILKSQRTWRRVGPS